MPLYLLEILILASLESLFEQASCFHVVGCKMPHKHAPSYRCDDEQSLPKTHLHGVPEHGILDQERNLDSQIECYLPDVHDHAELDNSWQAFEGLPSASGQ